MDKELKAKWVKKLRSGRVKQAHGRLQRGGAYCCLGVLRTILPPKVRRIRNQNGDYVGLLAPKQGEFCGLDKDTQNHLASMNDGLNGNVKHDFAQIAEYIEKNL